jgi:rubredoxin
MRYICTNCHFVFDESLWVPEEDILPQTFFSDLSYDFSCPQCEEPKEHFDLINEEILYPNNKEDLTDMEALHIPKIEIIWDKLNVSIGIVDEHPMEWNHNILSISLYDEYWELVEEKMIEELTSPDAEFDLSFIDEFEVRSRCSLHWTWSSGLLNR